MQARGPALSLPVRTTWLLVVFISACRSEPAASPEPQPAPDAAPVQAKPELDAVTRAYTESIRAVLEERCGRCHLPDQDGARPEILAVFNLADDIWWRNMTPARWSIMIDRLEGQTLEAEAEEVRQLADRTVGAPASF